MGKNTRTAAKLKTASFCSGYVINVYGVRWQEHNNLIFWKLQSAAEEKQNHIASQPTKMSTKK